MDFKKLSAYFYAIYIAIFVSMCGVVAFFNIAAAVVFFVVFCAYSFFLWKKIKSAVGQIGSHVENRTNQSIFAQKNLVNALPIPFVVTKSDFTVDWYNSLFGDIMNNQSTHGQNIGSLFPNFSKELIKAHRCFDFEKDESQFVISAEKFEQDEKVYYVFFMLDVTETRLLAQMLNHEKTAIAFIFIDNYDEVLAGLEDFRHSLLIGLVDRNITSFAEQINGVVRKFENDKYILVFSYSKIQYLKENKFSILNQVRDIRIGEHQPVTLSMGIGVNGATHAQSMQFARSAIDLALGRGGDQVLIKDNAQLSFYGGKSKEMEQNTRVRARVKAYALSELMEEASNVLVMGHINPDLDCFGAAVGIYRMTASMNRKCKIVLNSVNNNIKRMHDHLLELEDYKEAVVHEQAALQMLNERTLVIVVDTHRTSLVESHNVLSAAKKVVILDHHRKSADFIDYAVLTYHEPYASSTCELVTELIQYISAETKLKPAEADALLAGITIDTKSFTFKAGTKTFEAAAYLKRSGADTVRVKNFLKSEMDVSKAKAAAIRDAEIYRKTIAISTCPNDFSNTTLAAAQAADELLNIIDIEASFVLCHNDNRIAVSARSVGTVNVQVIMEKLGGGGHHTIAGAQLPDATMYSARDKVKRAINEYLEEE